uniref:Putative secreted protein n=1 Tax=Anopheles triannulatus TaxID=58253 RepID=A0A2M4B4Q8_9DIPT
MRVIFHFLLFLVLLKNIRLYIYKYILACINVQQLCYKNKQIKTEKEMLSLHGVRASERARARVSRRTPPRSPPLVVLIPAAAP